jgi:hypothetical protein
MELVAIVRELLRHKLLVAAAVAIAVVVAVATAYKLPSMEKRNISVGAATGQILVDSNPSTLVAGGGSDTISSLGSRAQVYAQYLSSRDAVAQVAERTGIPARLITARGPFSQGTGISNYDQQPAESRAKDLVDEGKKYRLVFEAQEDVPIITVYSTGPTAPEALELAQSSFVVLENYVAQLKEKSEAAAKERGSQPEPGAVGVDALAGPDDVVVRELGEAEAGTVGGGADKAMMAMAFLAALGVQLLLLVVVLRFRAQRELEEKVDELTGAALMSLVDAPGDKSRPDDLDERELLDWETPQREQASGAPKG